MAKLRTVQTNFGRGELDPLLAARFDIKAYASGGRRFRNMHLYPQGGGRRRPGSERLAELASGTVPAVRLADFIFDDGQEYAFVFLDQALRVYDMDGALLTSLAGCPWTAAMLPRLWWSQQADTMIITHPDLAPQKILRTGASSFARSALAYETSTAGVLHAPRFKHADDAMTITPSATTGAITLTTSAAHWVAGHVNLRVWVKGKQCQITGIVSTTVANATVKEDLADTNATADWEEEAFSAIYGYPATSAFLYERMVFGGHKAVPDGVWGSKTGAYFNHDPGEGADGDAFAVTIGHGRLNEIRAIVPSRDPQFFTDEGEFYIPVTESRPLTPGNVSFRKQTPFGSAYVTPRELDGATVFVQKSAPALREFLWSDTQQAYSSESVSLLSSHLISGPIELATVFGAGDLPSGFALLLNGDGTLAQFQSIRNEEVAGWSLWSTDGAVKSMASINGKVFLAVERDIAGTPVLWLERLRWEEWWTLDGATHLTAAADQTIWSGLDAYEGEEIAVCSGRSYLGAFTPDASGEVFVGEINVTDEILAGFPFSPAVEVMPIETQLQNGPTPGQVKRLVRAVLFLRDTMSVSVNGHAIAFRQASDEVSEAPEPFTGQKEIWLRGAGPEASVVIEQPEPLQMTLLGLMVEVEV